MWLSRDPRRGPGPARRADERGDAVARQGLRRPHRRHDLGDARARRHLRRRRRHARPARRGRARRGTGLDVGSPFDYPQAGHPLRRPAPAAARPRRPRRPRPSTRSRRSSGPPAAARWGCSPRCAPPSDATEAMRERFERRHRRSSARARTRSRTLVRQFARDPRTCLFGTLSLWQGVDVPGSACQLVIIDRIPFPRPDDPLASARSQAIARMGGNGFMAVSATHAALRLAQGAGRLIRRADDRGVVAFLDSRMMTARYAGFLQRSLPPFWPTTDRDDGAGRAAAPRRDRARAGAPSHEPALRGAHRSGRRHADGRRRGGAPASRSPSGTAAAAGSSRTAVTHGHAWTGRGRRGAARRCRARAHPRRARREPRAPARTSSRPGCAASASRHPGRPPSASTSGRRGHRRPRLAAGAATLGLD